MRGLRILAGAASLLVLSCVSYDFEPVNPYALTLERINIPAHGTTPPNIMLVIDKSGSMDLPMNPSDPDCGACGQNKSQLCNTATCATRWSELQTAMKIVLPTSNGVTRYGLITYPVDAVCGAPGSVRLAIPQTDDAQQLKNNAVALNTIIQGISSQGTSGTPNTTGGGTPTAAALKVLENESAYVPNDGREDLAVLLTDGLPNCNANNPNDWNSNPAACRCTLGTDCSGFPKQGCLDDSATVAQIQSLRARGIRVVVVGFGAEVNSGYGPDVLRALATAGGYSRQCKADADCATGDTCGNNVCSSGLFLPTNASELARLIEEIGKTNPCITDLSEPANPATVEVQVGPRTLSPSEWTLSGTTLTVTGQACADLTAATPTEPLDFRVWALRPIPEN